MSNSAMSMQAEHILNDTPNDTVQKLKFYPDDNNHILVAGCWDSTIRSYRIEYRTAQGPNNFTNSEFQTSTYNKTQMIAPVLSFDFIQNSTNLFAGCGDGGVYQLDLIKNGNPQKIGMHQKGCKEIIGYEKMPGIIFSGGWDGNINIWDIRQGFSEYSKPVMNYQFNNKIYTMDAKKDLFVVGLSEQLMAYFDLRKLSAGLKPEALFKSHLQHQTRRVCVFPDGQGFTEASIEGRVAVKYVDLNRPPNIDKDKKSITNTKDFAFRCHRDQSKNPVSVYAVHDIDFNPKYGTFATAGGDGNYIIWCKDSKSKILDRDTSDKSAACTAVCYSHNGELLAFTTGYDWSKGYMGAQNYIKPKIGVRFLQMNQRRK